MNIEMMEMPVPCENCGEWFDMPDGYGSEKWCPSQIICESCHDKESEEIEEDEYWEVVNIELSNALHGIEEKENVWDRLDEGNKKALQFLFDLKTQTNEEV